jgi:hypothetical protein
VNYVVGIVVSLVIFPFALCVIDRIRGTHWSCSVFGWHNGKKGPRSFDGCSLHATCSKCGKEVMQDSQGNWF